MTDAFVPADSVTQILGADHRRLDAVLADVKRCLCAGELDRAAARFREFRTGLERHIAIEEEVLFPAFESLTGRSDAGPTGVMRTEHAEIRRLMAEVAGHLDSEGHGSHTTPLAVLTARIYAHNGKEERILYPAIDRATRDAGTWDGLARRLAPL